MIAPSSSRRLLPCLLLLFVGLTLAAAATSRAGTIKFPSDGSSITLTLPEGWTTSESDNGTLQCTSADGDISFDLLPKKVIPDPKAVLQEAAQGLADAASLTDVKTQDGGEKANPNGVKIAGYVVIGKKGDVDYAGVVSAITPQTGDACAFQCFGVKSALLVHSKDMKAITDSFRSAQ